MEKLQVQQNNAVRAILNSDFRTPWVKLYSDAGIDPVDVCMKRTLTKIAYKGLNHIGAPI